MTLAVAQAVLGFPSEARWLRFGRTRLRGTFPYLRRDLEAVTAGLTLQYNSGAVEATVNKIKARKMQLFGHANHDLTRKLMLLT